MDVGDKQYDEVQTSPFSGLKIEISQKARDDRDPFSMDQLVLIFSASTLTGCESERQWMKPGDVRMTHAGRYWVPLISLFSGARLGKIVQLGLRTFVRNWTSSTSRCTARSAGQKTPTPGDASPSTTNLSSSVSVSCWRSGSARAKRGNYADVTDAILEHIRRGVITRTVINNMTFDGSTRGLVQMAVRDALIGFIAATVQAQAKVTKGRQRDGIEAARARTEERNYPGRKPSFGRDRPVAVMNGLAQGTPPATIARDAGVSRQTVHRIKDDPAAAEAALASWEQKAV